MHFTALQSTLLLGVKAFIFGTIFISLDGILEEFKLIPSTSNLEESESFAKNYGPAYREYSME